jgi:hypothetical protein
MRLILIMGLLSFLFGGKSQAADFEIAPLTQEQAEFVEFKSKEAKIFISKYIGEKEYYDANNIDKVIELWRENNSENKKDENFAIETLGSYFGNIMTKDLPVEWFIYEDKQGTDFCVIHKEIFVYSFPYSSIFKAFVEKRIGTLTDVQSSLKEQIEESTNDPGVMERKKLL